MIVSAAVQRQVTAKLKESIALVEAHYGRTIKFPTVKYAKRGTTAGTANYNIYTLNFNAVLLMENIEDFIARTVPHEMAHLVNHIVKPSDFDTRIQMTSSGRYKRTKRNVHGDTFKHIMTVMGADDGSRCHNYDTTRSRVKKRNTMKHLYTCNTCGTHMLLGQVRHNKVLRGTKRFWMNGCGRHDGYTYIGVDGESTPQPLAAQAPAPKRPSPRKSSKLAQCRALYDWSETRQFNINQFVAEANCTTAGAATYYAKIKKGG